MNSDILPATASFWCYSCARFVDLMDQHDVVCPNCQSGFVEEIHYSNQSPAMSLFADGLQTPRRQGIRRRRRNTARRSPFNPVIVLRGAAEDGAAGGNDGNSSFELYYDDGDGSGLRPLPPTMSEFLLGSGFDRLLEQFSQIEVNGFGQIGNPPASKAAVESMPTVEIAEQHVDVETHCAVCKEAFELGSEAREMPCKHLYHSDCIIPWLSMRNSCPVCRHELPADQNPVENRINGQIEEEGVGLIIWRLPGGGFAVGRFTGGQRNAENNLPRWTEVEIRMKVLEEFLGKLEAVELGRGVELEGPDQLGLHILHLWIEALAIGVQCSIGEAEEVWCWKIEFIIFETKLFRFIIKVNVHARTSLSSDIVLCLSTLVKVPHCVAIFA
ncbi:hypothetical protein Lal_00009864 [Lupinus albus]|nr:hypothetical protein Lal_00009864 [Lupinus albus]